MNGRVQDGAKVKAQTCDSPSAAAYLVFSQHDFYRIGHCLVYQGGKQTVPFINPLPDDSSKLKEFADDSVKFDENRRK